MCGSPAEGHRYKVQDLLKEGLAAGRTFFPQITGGSMSPFICIGDKVQVRAVDLNALRPGDIVVLESADGLLMAHRYIHLVRDREKVHLFTKGDRSLAMDHPWPEDALFGRVEAIVRGDRQLQITRGWGQTMHRLLAALLLWEQRKIDNGSSIPHRLFHKIIRVVTKFLSLLAWSTSLPGSSHR